MGEQSPRLTRGRSAADNRLIIRGLSAVYQRDGKRFFFLAADSGPTVSVYLFFSMQGMSGNLMQMKTKLAQDPDIPRAGRVGAHCGVAGRGRAGLGANIICSPRIQASLVFPEHRENVA